MTGLKEDRPDHFLVTFSMKSARLHQSRIFQSGATTSEIYNKVWKDIETGGTPWSYVNINDPYDTTEKQDAVIRTSEIESFTVEKIESGGK